MENEKKQFDLSIEESGLKKMPRAERTPKKNTGNVWYYLGAFGNIGFSIAFPIALGALIGVWIDDQFTSHPVGTLAGLLGGLIISVLGFLRMIQRILRGDYNPK
jgi:predicted F0F1-ATPase subunit